MATPTSASLIAAARDSDLRARLIALGAINNYSAGEVELAITRIVAAPVTESGETISSVYEYAVANYEPAPRPGEDPAAVTDTHLLAAIESVLGGGDKADLKGILDEQDKAL